MSDGPTNAGGSVVHYFVDEAGDPTLFNGKGQVIVGNDGCSTRFILGKLDVADPDRVSRELRALQLELLADPYFYGVPSMHPGGGKTAEKFHAKDDLPEVRREVFHLLARHDVRFYAVVRDKRKLAVEVQAKNAADPHYRYRENDLYDAMAAELFSRLRSGGLPAETRVCFSARGSSDRTRALAEALKRGEETFKANFGFDRNTTHIVTAAAPAVHGGLQAVDYFLWAVQRFFEKDEDRYVRLIWEQVGEIADLDAAAHERYYRHDRPLWENCATPHAGRKKKKKPRL